MHKSMNINPFSDNIDKTERLGYVPFQKRVAAILTAGIQLKISRDEFFDSFDDESFPPPPPMPLHLDADLADVSELARLDSSRRRDIEERLAAHSVEQDSKVARSLERDISTESAVIKSESIDKSAPSA